MMYGLKRILRAVTGGFRIYTDYISAVAQDKGKTNMMCQSPRVNRKQSMQIYNYALWVQKQNKIQRRTKR